MPASADDQFISVVRSEERLRADVVRTPVQRAVLRRVIVSEERTITVTVRREEFRLDYAPIELPVESAPGSAAPQSSTVVPIEMVLHEERIEIVRTVVPIERVRVVVDAVVEQQELTDDVRVERVEIHGVDETAITDTTGRHRL